MEEETETRATDRATRVVATEGTTGIVTIEGMIEVGANCKSNSLLYVCRNEHNFKHKLVYTCKTEF